jgi:hypothetical protein
MMWSVVPEAAPEQNLEDQVMGGLASEPSVRDEEMIELGEILNREVVVEIAEEQVYAAFQASSFRFLGFLSLRGLHGEDSILKDCRDGAKQPIRSTFSTGALKARASATMSSRPGRLPVSSQ